MGDSGYMDWGELADMAADRLGDGRGKGKGSPGRESEPSVIPGEEAVTRTSARGRQEWTDGVLVLTTHRLVYTKEGKQPVLVPLTGVTDVMVSRSRISGAVLKV